MGPDGEAAAGEAGVWAAVGGSEPGSLARGTLGPAAWRGPLAVASAAGASGIGAVPWAGGVEAAVGGSEPLSAESLAPGPVAAAPLRAAAFCTTVFSASVAVSWLGAASVPSSRSPLPMGAAGGAAGAAGGAEWAVPTTDAGRVGIGAATAVGAERASLLPSSSSWRGLPRARATAASSRLTRLCTMAIQVPATRTTARWSSRRTSWAC